MNPYAILGAVLLWLASLTAVGAWQNKAGHAAERVGWQAREITQQATYAAATKAAEENARAAEQQHARDMAVVAANYERKLENAQAQKDRDVAAAHAGALVLRIPTPACPACGSGPGQAAAPASGGDGGTYTQLPAATTGRLFALADDADAVVLQLQACQAVVAADRAP